MLAALNLDDQRLNIIGYSMGGAIAASFVTSRLDNVERLLLIAPAGMVVWFPVFRAIAQNLPFLFDPIIRAGLPKALESQFKDSAKNYPDDLYVQQVLANHLAELQSQEHVAALLSSLKGALASPKRNEHQVISDSEIKVRAIFAGQDKTIPYPYAEQPHLSGPT